jgi:hypothetical protein
MMSLRDVMPKRRRGRAQPELELVRWTLSYNGKTLIQEIGGISLFTYFNSARC